MVIHSLLSVRRAASRAVLAATTAFVLLLPASVAAGETVRFVDDDGKGSATGCSGNRSIPSSIQSAVDQSGPGDRVIVCPGTYVGRVIVDVPRLTIRGRDPWTAIVKPAPDHPSSEALIQVQNAHHSKITWLQLVAPTSGQCAEVGSMIVLNNSPASEVRANHIGISGNQGLGPCGFEVGIRVEDSGGTRVVFNRVTDFQTAGLFILDSPDALALGNTIRYFHRELPAGGFGNSFGILLNSNVAGVRIRGNAVRGLPSGGQSTPIFVNGIFITETPALVVDNTISNVAWIMVLLNVQGGEILSNTARRGLQSGIGVNDSHGSLISGNRVSAPNNSIAIDPESTGHNIHDNNFKGPAPFDCFDFSTGGGTAGTANTWSNNLGTSLPEGICEPE
jgi:copper-binding protein NosD